MSKNQIVRLCVIILFPAFMLACYTGFLTQIFYASISNILKDQKEVILCCVLGNGCTKKFVDENLACKCVFCLFWHILEVM